jgi:hypothetical protein
LLYVTSASHRVLTVTVPTLGQRRAALVFPVVRLWALVQSRRATLAAASSSSASSASSSSSKHGGGGGGLRGARQRDALWRLTRCAEVAILARVLSFLTGSRFHLE